MVDEQTPMQSSLPPTRVCVVDAKREREGHHPTENAERHRPVGHRHAHARAKQPNEDRGIDSHAERAVEGTSERIADGKADDVGNPLGMRLVADHGFDV